MMISKYGFYTLVKKDTSNEVMKMLEKELIITPVVKKFKNTPYKIKPEKIDCILESPKYYFLPRFYGLQKFGPPVKGQNNLGTGQDIDFKFRGSLFEEQKEPVDCVLSQLNQPYFSGGILSLPCGEGKTVSSIYVISQIKKKTIIVVHKEFLMEQWKDEINTFLAKNEELCNVKIGYIQGKTFQVEDCDIVIGMIQTMSKKDYDFEIMKEFGLAIFDECHHLGAKLFSKVLQKIPSKCLLGLSAEPIRKDGMNLVFEYYLGNVIYQRTRQQSNAEVNYPIQVFNFQLHSNDPCFEAVYDSSNNKLLYKMEENIVTYDKRNMFIIYLLKNLFNPEISPFTQDRQILVLSARNDGHLPLLYELLRLHCPHLKVGFYVGRNGINKKKHSIILEESKSSHIILGTYDMAQEGLNIKSLNAIFLASPLVGLQNQVIRGQKKEFSNDIKQTVGRIFRDKKSFIPRLIFDLTDCFANYIEWARQRMRYYQKENYEIFKYKIQLNDFIFDDMKCMQYFHYIENEKICKHDIECEIDVENENENVDDEISGEIYGECSAKTQDIFIDCLEEKKPKCLFKLKT